MSITNGNWCVVAHVNIVLNRKPDLIQYTKWNPDVWISFCASYLALFFFHFFHQALHVLGFGITLSCNEKSWNTSSADRSIAPRILIVCPRLSLISGFSSRLPYSPCFASNQMALTVILKGKRHKLTNLSMFNYFPSAWETALQQKQSAMPSRNTYTYIWGQH